ncbi:hypothetical protein [Paenibacillus apiarius]|uniref:hypothetical protein n=1 Tax=Paenibacillus apiarius TaxID=46240 RepID=UPI003B3AA7A2
MSATQVKIEPHAIKRATERFGVKHDDAGRWIREQFTTAVFIGDSIDSFGAHGRIYSNGEVVFGVAPLEMRIRTVFKPEHRHPELAQKVSDFLAKEIRKIERSTTKIKREASIKIAELNVEAAQLELRKVTSRSESVNLACDARIRAISEEVRELNRQINAAILDRHLALKTKAAYV